MSNVPTNLIPTRITGLPDYTGTSTLGYFAYALEGRTYKVQFSQLAAVGAVPSTRVIGTGNGLEGGGDLSQNRVISIIPHGVGYSQLDFTGVTAGTYGSADTIPAITVDATGRVTAVVDTPVVLSNYVPSSRTVTAGAGLTGGGQLNNNITIALNPSNATPQSLGAASAGTGTQAARDDHVHPAVDLTDTSETQGVLPLGRGGTGVALSPVVGAVIYADNDSLNQTVAGNAGQILKSAGGLGAPYWDDLLAGGTVTSVSVITANGFAGTVANSTTTPAITLTTTVTGLVKANGSALSAAVAGTDYVAPGAITTSGLTMATARLLGRTTASSGAVEEITVGTGLSLSAGSLTNTAPDQVVSLTGGTAISISGTYPSFTITNTAPDQIVSLTGAGTTVVTGTYPSFTITSNDQYTGTVTSVAASGGTTGLTFSGSPITTSGTLTLGGTLAVASGGTGATDAATARTNLGAAASGANSDITSLSGITGSISTVDSITFDTTGGVTVGQGQIAWNSNDGTIDIGMGYDAVTQQVGLEQYFRIKASAAITDGQCVMFTGAVGASGVLTGAPATGVTNPQYIMGVATMDIANNGFGYITSFGLVRGINTTGSSVGETWVDGDILFYNPAYTGGLTKVEPIAPLPKVVVASVVNAASGGSGSLFIRVQAEPYLQGLTDVYAPSPISNGQILIGDGPQGRWEAATLTAGTNVSITNAAGAITINATDQYSGTVTSVDVSGGTTGLTTSGGPITTSGTITLGGTLGVANGGTGATTLTGYVKGNGTSAFTASATIPASDISSGAALTKTDDTNVTLTLGGSPSTALLAATSLTLGWTGQLGVTRGGTGTGTAFTAGSIVFAGASGVYSQDNANLFWDDSNNRLGVGTTSPGYAVEVTGDLRLGGGGDLRLGSATGTTGSSGDSSIYSDANDMNFSVGSNIRMYIANGGNVGIGNTGPGYRLDVAAADTTAGLGYGFRIRANATAAAGGMQFTDSGVTAQWGYLAATATSVTLDASGSSVLAFRTNSSERMRIDSSGNVGVGTSTVAGGRLQVSGATSDTDGTGLDQGQLLITDSDAATANGLMVGYRFNAGITEYGRIQCRNAVGATNLVIQPAGGNVGIGTNDPAYKLEVKGSPAWIRNFSGAAASPGETQDWPVSAFNVASYGDFSLQTMLAFTLPNDGNYFLGYDAWNFKLDQTASSTTSAGVNGMQFGGPGYLAFMPGTSEKARITSAGYLLVGTTAPLGGNTSNEFKNTTAGSWPLTLNSNDRGLLVRNSAAGSGFYAYFEYSGGTNNGSISWSGGTTAYNTTSDYRLKEIDGPITNSGAYIDALNPVQGSWKADGTRFVGLVAHEVQEVSSTPVVTGEKDGEMMQQMDYSSPEIIGNMIAELKSLRARVAQLEGN